MSDVNLPKIVGRRAKRVGRGYGSGKGGHTSGRGQKGQKVRGKIHILFEGYKSKKSLMRRLPQLRGKTKLKANDKPIVISAERIKKLPKGSKPDRQTLVKLGLVSARDAKRYGVKILGKRKIEK